MSTRHLPAYERTTTLTVVDVGHEGFCRWCGRLTAYLDLYFWEPLCMGACYDMAWTFERSRKRKVGA